MGFVGSAGVGISGWVGSGAVGAVGSSGFVVLE